MQAFLHRRCKRRFFNTDCCLEHSRSWQFMCKPVVRVFVFHNVVTPNVSWPSFSQRSLQGPLGSLCLLWCPIGCGRVECGRDEAWFPTFWSLLSSHVEVSHDWIPPHWCPAAVCSIFSKYFPSLSPEAALISCSAKSSCSLQLLPQF